MASQQRTLRTLAETENIGADTAVELKRQGEQLAGAENKLDRINTQLDTAEYHVKTINSWFGSFMNKFRKKPNSAGPSEEPSTSNADSQGSSQTITDNSRHEASQSRNHTGQLNDSTRRMQQAGPDGKVHQYDLYEGQINDNLDLIGNGLSNLRQMGLNLQTELTDQDKVLNRLNGKMGRVENRTEKVNSELRRLNK